MADDKTVKDKAPSNPVADEVFKAIDKGDLETLWKKGVLGAGEKLTIENRLYSLEKNLELTPSQRLSESAKIAQQYEQSGMLWYGFQNKPELAAPEKFEDEFIPYAQKAFFEYWKKGSWR